MILLDGRTEPFMLEMLLILNGIVEMEDQEDIVLDLD